MHFAKVCLGRLGEELSSFPLCCRPDAKNAQYQQTIKQGDLLLNRIQRLSKVVDLE